MRNPSGWNPSNRDGIEISFRPAANLVAIAVMLALAMAMTIAWPGQAQARYASIVIDMDTGRVLHETNADTRNYPASLTKMMTLFMTFEALEEGRLQFSQRLPVSNRAEGMTPSKLWLKAGETITVKDAVLALVTRSANDAAVVLAEALGGTEFQFALNMTERARKLGMTRTQFRNASGLPDRHQLSTARDMARLARALLTDFPQYYSYFSTEQFSYGGRNYGNHNNLLESYAGTDGIKTGYTRASGFNLAASVVRDNRRLIGIVFGGRTAKSRDSHMVNLLDRSFAKLDRMEAMQVVGPPPPKPTDVVRTARAGADEIIPEDLVSGSVAVAEGDAAGSANLPVPPSERPRAVSAAAEEWAEGLGEWAVQVGAFRSAKPARMAAMNAGQQARDLLTGTRVSISRVSGNQGAIYRARLVGLSQARASEACRTLHAAGTDCLVIKPTGGIEVAVTGESSVN